MRHQADGRLGSEVREANKGVRDAAAASERALHKEELRGERMDRLFDEQRGWMRDMQARHTEDKHWMEQRYDEEKREGRADRARLLELQAAYMRLAERFSQNK